MSNLLSAAAISLMKREAPRLVAATGLLFRELEHVAEQHALEAVLVSARGGTWGEDATPGYGHPVLRSTNMRGAYVDVTGAAWRHVLPIHVDRCALETGDILVIKSSGSTDLVGKAALFVHPGDGTTYLYSNFTLRLRPNQRKVLPEYVAWFLRSPQALMWRYEAQHTTVGLRNLKTRDFLRQSMPVPAKSVQQAVVNYLDELERGERLPVYVRLPLPLDKQRRIVARIEELAALIDEARALRAKAREEAEALAARARAEIFRRFDMRNEAWVPLDGVTVRITKGESPGWQGFDYVDSGPLFVRSQNVLWQRLELSSTRRIPVAFHEKLSRSQLRPGDVLINLVGASIGRSAVVPENLGEANVNQAVAVITPMPELLPGFLMHFFVGPLAQQILHSGKVETARPNISLTDLRGLRLPVPSLAEQCRVVGVLDDLQAQLDELTTLQDATQAQLEALLPSVLDRAFRGQIGVKADG